MPHNEKVTCFLAIKGNKNGTVQWLPRNPQPRIKTANTPRNPNPIQWIDLDYSLMLPSNHGHAR